MIKKRTEKKGERRSEELTGETDVRIDLVKSRRDEIKIPLFGYVLRVTPVNK